MSYNDELRLMGLRGDDEDDMCADQQVFFGSSVAAVEIQDDPHPPAVPAHGCGASAADCSGSGTGTPSVNTGTKRTRSTTSKAWNDFKQLFESRNGKQVRTGANCKHCHKVFSGLSSGATGHLLRHIPKCPVLKGRAAMSQTQLKFNPDGSVHTWDMGV